VHAESRATITDSAPRATGDQRIDLEFFRQPAQASAPPVIQGTPARKPVVGFGTIGMCCRASTAKCGFESGKNSRLFYVDAAASRA